MYTAVPLGSDSIACIKTENGMRVNQVRVGKIISGPVVSGETCTVVIEESNGSRTGKVFKMPNLLLQNTFRA